MTTLPGEPSVQAVGPRTVLIDGYQQVPRLVPDDQPLDGGLPVVLPAGCLLAAVGGDRILATCPDRIEIYDMDTGAWRVPAGSDALEAVVRETSDTIGAGASFIGIGASLVRMLFQGKVSNVALADPETGAFVEPKPLATAYETLDTPTGTARLCPPVRTQSRRVPADYGGYDVDPQQVAAVGPWVLRWWDRGVAILQHCGASRGLVLDRHPNSTPVLTDRYAAWASERALHVRWLASGRTQRIQLPRPHSSRVSYGLEGTSHRLFVRRSPHGPAQRWRVYHLP